MRLDGKVAIVTGASRGCGKYFALALAQAGAAVVVAARSDRPGALPGTIQDTVEEIRRAGGTAIGLRCDVSVPDDIAHLVGQTIYQFGRLDILVNNAALANRMPFGNVTPALWEAYFRTNVVGPYLAAQEAFPHLLRQGSGSIINITSGAATVPVAGSAMRHHGLYAITKAALDRFTVWLAAELKPYNIAVNALSPGPTITEGLIARFPVNYDFAASEYEWREASVEYLGPPVVYLAGQDAQGLTGQVLRIDDFGKTWPAAS